MIGDQVTLIPGSAHNLRMPFGTLPDDKKSSLHIFFAQQVQQSRRIFWIGPIVEGQRHAAVAFHLRTVGHQPLIAGVKE